MSKYPINKSRICHICKDVENRDATQHELQFMIVVRWTKVYKDNRWTGQYICSRCKLRNYAKERRNNKDYINV